MAKIYLLLSLLFVALHGCSPKQYDSATCNKLSMDSFKGSPKAAHALQKHCQDVHITYNHEVCQNALNDLVLSGKYTDIIKKYGAGVEGCFTENDLIKFRQ